MEESHLLSLIKYISNIPLELESAYDNLFSGFTNEFNMPIIFVPIKKDSFCFRSRNNISGEDFCNFSDLSYPASEHIKKFSRANKPEQQVFYCSDNFKTNLTELLPSWSKDIRVGDSFAVTIGKWNFKKDLIVAIVPDLTNSKLMALLENKLFVLKNDTVLNNYWAYINTYFRVQGIYQPTIYKFTSAFCNAIISNSKKIGEKIEGVLYTSIQDTTTMGWNLAVTPKFVDENLELIDVFKIIFHKKGDENSNPVYNNSLNPQPIFPMQINKSSQKIVWK